MTIDAVHRPASSGAVQASAQASPGRPAAKVANKPGPFVQFEAFVLQSFIQSIMPQDATAVFGEGTAGEVWRSMMAEKIAMQVAEAGGIGIAKMITPKANVATDIGGPAAQALKSSSADRLLEMQLGQASGSVATTALTSLAPMAPGRATGRK